MTANIRTNPRSLWNAYNIPRGISTVKMKGGMVRIGKDFNFLATDGDSAVSELDRRKGEPTSPGTDPVGIFRKALHIRDESVAAREYKYCFEERP